MPTLVHNCRPWTLRAFGVSRSSLEKAHFLARSGVPSATLEPCCEREREHGSRGFDVLCITDHVCRTDLADGPAGITAANYGAYLAEIDEEVRRARERYGLLVVPGLELTYNET